MAATESSTRAMVALDDLYRRHVGDVYRYTYAVLGNHADAEDVTQTTFVNALRALERGETPQNPSHWLLAISHNLVRQRWRQASSRPTVVELVHDVPEEVAGDEDVELDELVRALQRIPPSQREALVMRELEGRPYNEIAELLGVTTSALETLLFRARRSLADELENIVTCQNAELAISKQLDGRLSRKERRRLDEHVAECEDCARLAATAKRQRKAFKGLAILPLPVGLALFKGAPTAGAATVTSIGLAGSGATGVATTGVGAGAAGGSALGGGAVAGGGTVAGGTLLGGTVAKVAAVVVAASVATGVGYQGVKAVRDEPTKPVPAKAAQTKSEPARPSAGAPSGEQARAGANVAPRPALPTPPVNARGDTTAAPGRVERKSAPVTKTNSGNSTAAKQRAAAKQKERTAAVPKDKAAKQKAPPEKGKSAAAPGKIKPGPGTPADGNAGATPTPKPTPTPQNPAPGRSPGSGEGGSSGSSGNGPGAAPTGQAAALPTAPFAASGGQPGDA